MANSKKKCKHCKEFFPAADMFTAPVGTFCTRDHAILLANAKQAKEKADNEAWKASIPTKPSERKDFIKSRADWLNQHQRLVNQYVSHVKDKDEPCCTCGTTKTSIKYDAGHCFTRAARSDLRYELTNIHRQCSNYCNQNNSGFQEKHKKFIADKYGADHLAKLEDRSQWSSLKETFPDNESIKQEMIRYRKLLRDNGITPYA